MPTKNNFPSKKGHKGTRKTRVQYNSLEAFEKQITCLFLEMLMMIKLFHWKTTSYSTHKATDELYEKLNGSIDEFIEILLGKTNSRINLTQNKKIRLIDLSSPNELKREVEKFKKYLVDLNENAAMKKMSNPDLLSIRDTILGHLNQFLYLLSFK
tara:strand:- start:16 stop:480 length:465 start_codon:yes stop_codon:yes gene_type:complete